MAKYDQGITRAGRGEEQPTDKECAQTAHQTKPGTMPTHPAHKGDDDGSGQGGQDKPGHRGTS
jgi:hypothetical protein